MASNVNKGLEKRKVLIFNRLGCSTDHFDPIIPALKSLKCQITKLSDWTEVIPIFKDPTRRIHLLIVDANLKRIDVQLLKFYLSDVPIKTRPHVALFSTDRSVDTFPDIQDDLDLAAVFHSQQSRYQMAFILNRLLFSEMADKRRNPRVMAELEVEYLTYKDRKRQKATALNLSSCGMFISTDSTWPKRTFFNLSLKLPQHLNPIQCKGRVAFSRNRTKSKSDIFPPGMGIHFKCIVESDQEAIDRFVRPRLLPIDRKKR